MGTGLKYLFLYNLLIHVSRALVYSATSMDFLFKGGTTHPSSLENLRLRKAEEQRWGEGGPRETALSQSRPSRPCAACGFSSDQGWPFWEEDLALKEPSHWIIFIKHALEGPILTHFPKDLEMMVLSWVRQKDKYHDITCVLNLKQWYKGPFF